MFDSRHTNGNWCISSLRRAALCHLLPCRTILSAGLQTRGIIRHNGIYPCSSWRYGPSFVCNGQQVNSLGLGTGAYKLGVNYAPGVVAQREAAKLGYVQNLWLHGPEHYLTEVLANSLPSKPFTYKVLLFC